MVQRLVSYSDLRALGINFTRAWISRLEKRGLFPKRIRIGCGERGRIAWLADEIDAWLEDRTAARGMV